MATLDRAPRQDKGPLGQMGRGGWCVFWAGAEWCADVRGRMGCGAPVAYML